jgi:hypothetical protein
MTMPPSFEEVQHYILQRRNGIDPEYFYAFYTTNGWVQGKGRKPIKDWKSCVITWEKSKPVKRGDIMGRLNDTSWAD